MIKQQRIKSQYNNIRTKIIFNRKQFPLTESERNSIQKNQTYYQPERLENRFFTQRKKYQLTQDEYQNVQNQTQQVIAKPNHNINTNVITQINKMQQKQILQKQRFKSIYDSQQKIEISDSDSSLTLQQDQKQDELVEELFNQTNKIKQQQASKKIQKEKVEINLITSQQKMEVEEENYKSIQQPIKQNKINFNQKLNQLNKEKKSKGFDYDKIFKKIQLPPISRMEQNIQNYQLERPKQEHNKIELEEKQVLIQKQPQIVFRHIKKNNIKNRNTIQTFSEKKIIEVKRMSHAQLQNYIKQYKILKQIFENIRTQQFLHYLKIYINQILNHKIEYLEYVVLDFHQERILKRFLFLLNLTILSIGFCVAVDVVIKYINFLSNAIHYSHENYLYFLLLNYKRIIKLNEQSEQCSQLSYIVASLKNIGQKRIFEKIKNNNEIIWQIVGKILKQKSEFHQIIKNTAKNIYFNKTPHLSKLMYTNFAAFLHTQNIFAKLPFMAIAPSPFLSRMSSDKQNKYTLVIDIFNTIIYQKKTEILIRPLLHQFLQQISKSYEIISFSNQLPKNIDSIINSLDTQSKISARLYRYHMSYISGKFILDLTKIGRDLKKLIFLTAQSQIDNNYLNIKPWRGNNKDTKLQKLIPYLKQVAQNQLDWQMMIYDKNLNQYDLERNKRNYRF